MPHRTTVPIHLDRSPPVAFVDPTFSPDRELDCLVFLSLTGRRNDKRLDCVMVGARLDAY
jgi:hypothetical protein